MSLMPPPPNNNLVVVASTGLGGLGWLREGNLRGGLRVDCPIEFYCPFLLMVHMVKHGQISKLYYMVFICKFFNSKTVLYFPQKSYSETQRARG